MIHGRVSDEYEPVIPLSVRGPGGLRVIETVIDTGFNGELSLPSTLIDELDLPWRDTTAALLADDSEILVDLYEATIEWHGTSRAVYVDEGGTTPLAGMALLAGSELRMKVVSGGEIDIDELP